MRINAVDLRQLRYFVCVAEELHFGRAAKRLNMSQPPLSQQIMVLEDHLGVVLFRRTQRRVEMTPAGEYLLPEARRILQDMARVAEQTKQAEAGLAGHLRIGVNFSAPFHPVTTKLLQAYHKRYPHVRVELVLHEEENVLQLADLQSANLDLALIWLDDWHRMTDTVRIDLATDLLQVAVPSDHPLAKKKEIHIGDLEDEPFIAQPRYAGTQRYDTVMKAFATAKIEPRIVYDTLQMPLVMNMVAAGQGVTMLPAFLAQIPMSGIVFRPLVVPRGEVPHMTYNLIAMTTNKNAAVENFLALTREFTQ